MNQTARQQYELACRIDRLWSRRRIDRRTAIRLLEQLPAPVATAAMKSFPAPAPTWSSSERWIRFMEIKAQLRRPFARQRDIRMPLNRKTGECVNDQQAPPGGANHL